MLCLFYFWFDEYNNAILIYYLKNSIDQCMIWCFLVVYCVVCCGMVQFEILWCFVVHYLVILGVML